MGEVRGGEGGEFFVGEEESVGFLGLDEWLISSKLFHLVSRERLLFYRVRIITLDADCYGTARTERNCIGWSTLAERD